jgi:hypothetical protein
MEIEIKLRYLIIIGALLLLVTLVKSAEEVQTSSLPINATVGQVISIKLSNALEQGIMFDRLQPGTNNNMALNDTTGTGNCTGYYIEVESSSTSSVNLWHKASGHLTSGSATILIGNLTHEANKTSNGVNVNMSLTFDGSYPLTLEYAKIGGTPAPCDNTSVGGTCYIAFWLDVPSGIPSGVYNTTYVYCANATLGTAECS